MSFLWDKVIRPLAFRIDAERAHDLGIKALAKGLAAGFYSDAIDPILKCERFGLRFKSPLGIAAGFDKNGIVVAPLAHLGFGFVEVGTVTARAQPGNTKPRVFRLPDDRALINRLGFNNDGASVVAQRIPGGARPCVIGLNIGRSKDVPNQNAISNYLEAFEAIRGVADYIVINVSSPNTPDLRELQRSSALDELLSALQERNIGAKPLLVKIAPDLTENDIAAIVDNVLRRGLAGIVATNTTVSREGLNIDVADLGSGGLSGAPLRHRSTEVIGIIYKLTEGKLPIIGVGGIFTAEDAFEKITAGASLVQAYTGFIYGGPSFPATVNRGLARLLRERGFISIDEAIGTAH
jgi:dihydroorotate dehydrogenase